MAMPTRFSVVGDLERGEHGHLPADALCYFWGEYTPFEHTNGSRWNYSATNQLITNFKKKMDQRGQPGWSHKNSATVQIAAALSRMWRWPEVVESGAALIPVPPSKARTDPMYDDRLVSMLTALSRIIRLPLDIRDCLSFDGTCAASHETVNRPTPSELYQAMTFDAISGKATEPPTAIFLLDDMLTTGAHFVAAKKKLQDAFPGVDVYGMFIARRRLPNPFDDIDELL